MVPLEECEVSDQAARCMDCGIPFCHKGCPVNNQIPDWNDLVYQSDWQAALQNLHSTNNFPEVTGRICPAPCEEACTLNIEDIPVTIKTIECTIVDKGWEQGWIKPEPPGHQTGKQIAIIGAGPAGMAAAQQLARAGHKVDLYEKNARPGGLLVYGIPDFKLNKSNIVRRVQQMQQEGVSFHCGVEIGKDKDVQELVRDYDAVLLTGGSEAPNDFFATTPGRDLDGVHFAMEFLTQQNRRIAGESLAGVKEISAEGLDVVVIGGGDTGSDCIGTSFRQGAVSVTQLEIMPKPPVHPDKGVTWPDWPNRLRTSTSQEEGARREFSINTVGFEGKDGRVTAVNTVRVGPDFKPIAGTEERIKADLVLFATGFSGPRTDGLLASLGLQELVRRKAGKGVDADELSYRTRQKSGKIFAAGDLRRGQSLVVWAIREGRQAAHEIDKFLMGHSDLPR